MTIEEKAIELYPIEVWMSKNKRTKQRAYRNKFIEGAEWYQSKQDTKLREAAELVVDLWNDEDTETDQPQFHFAMDILINALK